MNENLKKSTIGSISVFIDVVNNIEADIYRGMSYSSYSLTPKIGRNSEAPPGSLRSVEKFILEDFKQLSSRHLNHIPTNDYDWLALGQNFGLPTRLLDWTTNPLVALFFACNGNNNRNGIVYFSYTNKHVNLNDFPNPFEIDTDRVWKPNHVTERISAQSGLFTITSNPRREFSDGICYKVIVKSSSKSRILRELSKLGINYLSLFPGLDGITKYLSDKYLSFLKHDTDDILRITESALKASNPYLNDPIDISFSIDE